MKIDLKHGIILFSLLTGLFCSGPLNKTISEEKGDKLLHDFTRYRLEANLYAREVPPDNYEMLSHTAVQNQIDPLVFIDWIRNSRPNVYNSLFKQK